MYQVEISDSHGGTKKYVRGATLSFDLEEGGSESINLFDRSSKIAKKLQAVFVSNHFKEITNLISSYLDNDSGNADV